MPIAPQPDPGQPVSPERADRTAQIRSQLAYHRGRLELYRRLHGSGPSVRLRELEDAYLSVQARLARSEADRPL